MRVRWTAPLLLVLACSREPIAPSGPGDGDGDESESEAGEASGSEDGDGDGDGSGPDLPSEPEPPPFHEILAMAYVEIDDVAVNIGVCS